MLAQTHRLIRDLPMLLLCRFESSDSVSENLVAMRLALFDALLDIAPSVLQF